MAQRINPVESKALEEPQESSCSENESYPFNPVFDFTDENTITAKLNRRMRKKLNKQFVELSAIVPGDTKIDKASILENAIEYMKELQEQEHFLEEQVIKKPMEGRLSEIKARFSEKNVLIKIHRPKNKGSIEEVLTEIEKLHLTIVNTSTLPFADYFLDITVVAQMDDGFCMTVKDLEINLSRALSI